MTDQHAAPALDTPAPEAPITEVLEAPALPPRGLSRRALAALIAGSALLHVALLGYAAFESRAWDARHPVVEVMDFHATTTVGSDGTEEVNWEADLGTHRARVSVAER